MVGLYLNPPDRALVLCVDEKSRRWNPSVPCARDKWNGAPMITCVAARHQESVSRYHRGRVPAERPPDHNYATHKTALIRNWFAKRPRFHMHFTPTSASWLNLVERWFGLLTEKQLRRGVHQSRAELETAIYRYLDVTNEDPKPFVWTKTADQILANVAHFCQRTLGH